MGVEKDNIKDLFSAKLGDGFEPEVPASIWAGIDMLLPQHSVPVPDPTSSTTSTTSSSSSASTSTSSSVASSTASTAKIVAITTGIAATVATGVIVVHNMSSISKDPVIIPAAEVKAPLDTFSIEEYREDTVYQIIPVSVSPARIAEVIEPVSTPDSFNVQAPEVEEEQVQEDEKRADKPNSLIHNDVMAEEADLSLKKITKGLSLGILAKADVLARDESQTPATLAMSPASYARYWDDIQKDKGQYELEHNQPISFGLTIGKQITPRISLETGLIYTYLSSTGRSTGNYLMDEKQTFHYLGVPLSINYTFYQLKKTKFYVSVGGMVQKDIQGRYKGEINMLYSQVDQSEDGMLQTTKMTQLTSSKSKISQDNPQFSTRIMLGASWPIYNKLSIYGTIGGAYYFDAGNEYKTIYSDQKTQLDLNLGLKIDF